MILFLDNKDREEIEAVSELINLKLNVKENFTVR